MEKLVNFMGYPAQILSLPDYDPNFFQRGLIIDKQRGNIIKMDRHMYVKIAYHGMRALDTEERRAIYGTLNQKSFSTDVYANIDTLFSLPDAFMFCQLVDFKDSHADTYPAMRDKSYAQIYKDVRRSVDLCHRDGVIKDRVTAEPERSANFPLPSAQRSAALLAHPFSVPPPQPPISSACPSDLGASSLSTRSRSRRPTA